MASNSEFPLSEAQIVALFVGSVLYGINLISIAAIFRALSNRESQLRVNKFMLTAAIALATIATLSISLELRYVLYAFIWYNGPGGASEEFAEASHWPNVVQAACYALQTFIGDLILIYRCFIVYNKRWLVILPCLLVWVGTVGSACTFIYALADLNLKLLVEVVESFTILTILQNFVTTTLITCRIWFLDRRLSQYNSDDRGKLRPAVRIIIESGSIYTFSVIVFLVVFSCASNAEYPLLSSLVQVIGITFNLLIIRVHRRRTSEQDVEVITHATSIRFGFNNQQPSSGECTQVDNAVGECGDAATEQARSQTQAPRLDARIIIK